MPKKCIGCKQYFNNRGVLCVGCLTELPDAQTLDYSDEVTLHRFAGYPEVRHFYYWLRFEKNSSVQHIIHALKYNNTPAAAIFLGARFASLLYQKYPELSYDCIIPIPIHWKTFWSRGYNQASYIAEGFLKKGFSTKIYSPLRKMSLQKSQNQKSKSYRLDRLSGLYKPNKQQSMVLKKSTVLLVDDLYTTGSTLESCIPILVSLGVKAIDIAVIGKSH